jgi:hypothetical protein
MTGRTPACEDRADITGCVIDWSTRPHPWTWIGPQFRRECEAIVGRPTTVAATVKARRLALGLTQMQLALAAGYPKTSATHAAFNVEEGALGVQAQRILAALDRLEAERNAA